MSYTKQDIQNIIARNKHKNSLKSPSPPFTHKSKQANRVASPKDMTLRYQELCGKYKMLLQQVKDKNHKFQLQQQQLQRLKAEKERDQKQIFRLRSMIGFIKKEDKGFQVNLDMQSGGSWSTGIQKSVTIDCPRDLQWNSHVKLNQAARLMRKISPSNKQMNRTTNHKNDCKPIFTNNFIENQSSDLKNHKFFTPKAAEKTIFYKIQQNKEQQLRSKLSNSPYSRLKFSRKIE